LNFADLASNDQARWLSIEQAFLPSASEMKRDLILGIFIEIL